MARVSRERWESFSDDLVKAVWNYASPSGALIDLPGPVSASGRWSSSHEAFTRTFLAAAFRVKGANGLDPLGLIERYARGLATGVDPRHPERWPTMAERRQSVVEAASLAIALHETRPWLWDQLADGTRSQTVDYLAGVIGRTGFTNNWTWFQTVIETFLAGVGGPWSQEDLDRNEEIQESLYTSHGWYSDGAGPGGSKQNFDYYAGWAWQVYPLLEARMKGTPLADRYRNRLGEFVEQAVDLIGSTGAPLFQGRSLTYRFAMLAPLWAAAIADVSPLAPGQTRQIADRVLQYFQAAGAVDDRGLLSIGWHREFLPIRQLYTGTGSTYWASKGLLGLLMPKDHPEWTASPTQADEPLLTQRVLTAPGWIVVKTEDDGVVRVINHGTDGDRHLADGARVDRPFYQRLGYSNVTAPDVTSDGIARPTESHVALIDAAGCPSHRGRIERIHLSPRIGVSRSRVHWVDLPGDARSPRTSDQWVGMRMGPLVTVASVVNGISELRLAWFNLPDYVPHPSKISDMDAGWPEDAGPWSFRLSGWQLPLVDAEAAAAAEGVVERRDGLSSSIVPVRGLDSVGVTWSDEPNPFGPASATPWGESGPTAPGNVVGAVVSLGHALGAAPAVSGIEVSEGRILASWSDGTRDTVPAEGVAG